MSPMAYFISVGALVVISAYSHVQFRANIQDEAYRAVASDQKKVIQFSQLNAVEEESPAAPEHLSGVAVEAKTGKKHTSLGDHP